MNPLNKQSKWSRLRSCLQEFLNERQINILASDRRDFQSLGSGSALACVATVLCRSMIRLGA